MFDTDIKINRTTQLQGLRSVCVGLHTVRVTRRKRQGPGTAFIHSCAIVLGNANVIQKAKDGACSMLRYFQHCQPVQDPAVAICLKQWDHIYTSFLRSFILPSGSTSVAV